MLALLHRLRFSIFGVLILAFLLMSIFALSLSQRHKVDPKTSFADEPETKIDDQTFSSTQGWDQMLLDYLAGATSQPSPIQEQALQQISLPPPPTNSSRETTAEIATLKSLMEQRASKQSSIEAEANNLSENFIEFALGDEYQKASYTNSIALLKYADRDLVPVVLNFKKEFDRIRPSYLDKSLTTTIEIPGHPAYPSGHASQAYTFALILTELDPDNSELYLELAESIARNREIAGLHYPSDSAAGKLLAEQFVPILMADEEFVFLLEAARGEWK